MARELCVAVDALCVPLVDATDGREGLDSKMIWFCAIKWLLVSELGVSQGRWRPLKKRSAICG